MPGKFLEKFLDVEAVSSPKATSSHCHQLSPEGQKDVTFTAVGSPSAPEEVRSPSPKRNWQKPGENTVTLKELTPTGHISGSVFFPPWGMGGFKRFSV